MASEKLSTIDLLGSDTGSPPDLDFADSTEDPEIGSLSRATEDYGILCEA